MTWQPVVGTPAIPVSGLVGASGLPVFSQSTAFMVVLIRKLHGGP